MHTETGDVVVGVVEGTDFQLATVAGTRVDLADRKTTVQTPVNTVFDLQIQLFGPVRICIDHRPNTSMQFPVRHYGRAR